MSFSSHAVLCNAPEARWWGLSFRRLFSWLSWFSCVGAWRGRPPMASSSRDVHRIPPCNPPSALAELEREASDTATSPARLERLAGERCVQHLVAANHATPVDVLYRLRRVPRRAVREAVAGNPNAPFELLRELVAEYPAEVLANPVWPWLLLEQPGLAERLTADLPAEAAAGMLRFASLPRALLNPLTRSSDEGVRHLAARHVALAAKGASGM